MTAKGCSKSRMMRATYVGIGIYGRYTGIMGGLGFGFYFNPIKKNLVHNEMEARVARFSNRL